MNEEEKMKAAEGFITGLAMNALLFALDVKEAETLGEAKQKARIYLSFFEREYEEAARVLDLISLRDDPEGKATK